MKKSLFEISNLVIFFGLLRISELSSPFGHFATLFLTQVVIRACYIRLMNRDDDFVNLWGCHSIFMAFRSDNFLLLVP